MCVCFCFLFLKVLSVELMYLEYRRVSCEVLWVVLGFIWVGGDYVDLKIYFSL